MASAYVLVDIAIHDRERYADYVQRARVIITDFGGNYLARSESVVPMFGDWAPERVILIEFPSLDAARRCFASDRYRAIAPIRESAATGRMIAFEKHEVIPEAGPHAKTECSEPEFPLPPGNENKQR